jgi:hypothetical protein
MWVKILCLVLFLTLYNAMNPSPERGKISWMKTCHTPATLSRKPMSKHLHVACMVTNPVGFKSRIKLFREFQHYLSRFKNVTLWIIEGVYPGGVYEVTEEHHHHHHRVALIDELWCKENLLNILVNDVISVRCPDWEYMAWIDADVVFARPDWPEATIAALQKFPVVQMFTEALDLTDRGETIQKGFDSGVMTGTVWKWWQSGQLPTEGQYRYAGHYGYAWAMTRQAWDILGGLIDTAIVGSADYLMSYGLFGAMNIAVGAGNSQGYRDAMDAWGERAKKLPGPPGFVQGLLMHHWHGPKSKRGYTSRQRILDVHKFDPDKHLVTMDNGAYRFKTEDPAFPIGMIQDFRDYFRSRDEDVSAYAV